MERGSPEKAPSPADPQDEIVADLSGELSELNEDERSTNGSQASEAFNENRNESQDSRDETNDGEEYGPADEHGDNDNDDEPGSDGEENNDDGEEKAASDDADKHSPSEPFYMIALRGLINQDEDYNVKKMPKQWKTICFKCRNSDERETFDQNIMYTMHVCSLNPKSIWTVEDLHNEDDFCFERALRLLNRKCFGRL